MERKLNKQALVCVSLLLIAGLAGNAAAQATAFEVMQQVDQRDDGDTATGEYTMVLVDDRNRQRSRKLRILSKDHGDDSKTVSMFESPADIAGTVYLNFDWDDVDRDDDSWLYLPSLQRVKRIASSDTSDSFMGSDFTYADINGFELNWYDYRFVSESEIIGVHDTWLIEVIAKPEFREKAEDATGYSKMHSWIRKDNFVQVQGQVWETRGNRIKFFNASEIEQIDGIWTVGRLQAVTRRNGRMETASVLQINNIKYNVDLDDELFTTENMQRGL